MFQCTSFFSCTFSSSHNVVPSKLHPFVFLLPFFDKTFFLSRTVSFLKKRFFFLFSCTFSLFKEKRCGGRDSNPRIPSKPDLKSGAFGHARQPPPIYYHKKIKIKSFLYRSEVVYGKTWFFILFKHSFIP